MEADLPYRGRNGAKEVFMYEHEDGTQRPVHMTRIVTGPHNCWQVDYEDWWVFEKGWHWAGE